MNIINYDASTYEGRLEIYNAMIAAYEAGNKEKFWQLNEYLPEVIHDLIAKELRYRLTDVISLAEKQEDEDIASRFHRIRPTSSFIAEAVKMSDGLDGLMQYGYNLAEVEAEHGKEWLTK